MNNKQSFKAILASIMEGKDMHAPMRTQGIDSIGIRVLQEREAAKAGLAFAALMAEPTPIAPTHEDVRAVYEQHTEDIEFPWTFVRHSGFHTRA